MNAFAPNVCCFVTVITLLSSACGYIILNTNNLEDMIENDSRKDVFSTADELALLKLLRPSKFDDLLLANSNALDKQIDESFADGNRQKMADFEVQSKRLACIQYGCKPGK
ncbi:uncharacterized protein [Mytilus edulis]|uniref:uncharacterized protein n=1 Tax=Mytilus edulis TaxID=6550 RepID=UPI0039EE9464